MTRTCGVSCSGIQLRAPIGSDCVYMNGLCLPAVCFVVSHCSAAASGEVSYSILIDSVALVRRRQIDDQRAAQDRIGLLQMKRPAHPGGLALRRSRRGRSSVCSLTSMIVKSLVSSTSCVARRVEPFEFERDRADQHLVVKIDPQVQIEVRDAELIDIGVGVIVEPD